MRENIYTIALTGGPSGGKSTLIRELQERMPEQVIAVPEAATILLGEGVWKQSLEIQASKRYKKLFRRIFQSTVASTQQSLELAALLQAIDKNKRVIVCDRGLPDGAAYLPRGMRELRKITGQSESEMLNRYDVVLHLASSAMSGVYDKASNPHRLEEVEEAIDLESKILGVWQNHPNRIILNHPDKQTRITQGLFHIMNIVNTIPESTTDF